MKNTIRAWIPELLLALTAVSCWTAGTSHAVDYRTLTIGREAALESVSPFDGLWFALGVLGILGSHELGHWWTARRYGLRISAPYFIPGPTFAGTFGAFLDLQDPPPTRRCAFDVAAAGPLAGLAVTLPVLWIGVTLSTPAPTEAASETVRALGQPALLQAASALVHGPLPDGYGLALHPLAVAAWIGMLLTALNLFPAGQLDGGRIAHALLPRHGARAAGLLATTAAAVLSTQSNVWFAWIIITSVMTFTSWGARGWPETPAALGAPRWAAAAALAAALALCFTPVPLGPAH